MGAAEVEAFLSYLAVERKVSASTQNQAKAALLYLYKQLLEVDLPWLDEVVQAKTPKKSKGSGLDMLVFPTRPAPWAAPFDLNSPAGSTMSLPAAMRGKVSISTTKTAIFFCACWPRWSAGLPGFVTPTA